MGDKSRQWRVINSLTGSGEDDRSLDRIDYKAGEWALTIRVLQIKLINILCL
ncbi:hypothetical protein J6590_075986 [Homalodisca vitripennis]|nr:hypothetical protein J6590_075986 [Homalodisca vitripennis]